jgi:hypothetical protein
LIVTLAFCEFAGKSIVPNLAMVRAGRLFSWRRGLIDRIEFRVFRAKLIVPNLVVGAAV